MRSVINVWLGASSVLVRGDEKFSLAVPADIHFIILAVSIMKYLLDIQIEELFLEFNLINIDSLLKIPEVSWKN